MPTIRFEVKPYKIGDWIILKLPQSASAKLPSRGLVMVKGAINGTSLQTALEPDGRGSHWFRLEDALRKTARLEAGNEVTLVIEPTKEWTEPKVPADIAKGLAANAQVHKLWTDITPMARWEWIRWIRATNSTETRERRIAVAVSKLKGGSRRPCCFNSSMCTEPSVSKNGVLLEPEQLTK